MKPGRKAKAAAAPQLDPRVLPLLEAVAAAAAVMDGETQALEGSGAGVTPDWAERKRQAEAAIRHAGRQAAQEGLEIVPGTPEAGRVEAALAALRSSVEANMLALKGAAAAASIVVSALKRASAEGSGEGMYSRAASRVAPAGRKGFGTSV